MTLKLFGLISITSSSLFLLNLTIDIVLLIILGVYGYMHSDFTVIVSEKYVKHLQRIFVVSIALLAFMTMLNAITFVRYRVTHFANNVIFCSTKLALCIFALSCIVLEFVYKSDGKQLLSLPSCIAIAIGIGLLIHLNALGLKACDCKYEGKTLAMPETAMTNEAVDELS